MPEKTKSFAEALLKNTARGIEDDAKSFTSERQHSAQSLNLHIEHKDGRSSEGLAWSHYTCYRWTDEGGFERLVVVFGTRAVEIEGHNLGVLITEIREGQLNGIKELASGQAQLLQQGNPDNQPVITSVRIFPDFKDVVKELKGEEERETRHARRIER
jgi:hypothetical protein